MHCSSLNLEGTPALQLPARCTGRCTCYCVWCVSETFFICTRGNSVERQCLFTALGFPQGIAPRRGPSACMYIEDSPAYRHQGHNVVKLMCNLLCALVLCMSFVPMFGVLYVCTRSGAFVLGERNHEDN